MIIKTSDKIKLRKYIEDVLKDYTSNKRLKLDTDCLTQLLFEIKDDIKYPVWDTDYLYKMDLSNINFDNVSWKKLTQNDINDLIGKKMTSEEFFNGFKTIKKNFSNTNAQINLNNSVKDKEGNIELSDCNFSNVDLSNNHIKDSIIKIYNSDLSNTNLSLDNISIDAYNSNLTGLNLSSKSLNISDYLDETKISNYQKCNLNNTNINIHNDLNDLEKEIFHKEIRSLLDNEWNGCILDGIHVNGYINYIIDYQKTINKYFDDIDNQVKLIFK